MFDSPLLLAPQTLHALQRAERLAPTAQERIEFAERRARTGESGIRGARIVNDAMEIDVSGVLTKHFDLFVFLFGGGNVLYGDVIDALAEAQRNPAISRAIMLIDSPGGTVDGLFETIDAIDRFRSSGKPLSVRASNAQSAAYAIAAAAGPIQATHIAANFGSVGAAAQFFVSDRIVDIANTKSPKKRPNVRTDEGKAIVREYLDSVFTLFVQAIGRGRDVSAAQVVEKFGKGATLLAGDALQRGMIDSVVGYKLEPVAPPKQAAATSSPVSYEPARPTVPTPDGARDKAAAEALLVQMRAFRDVRSGRVARGYCESDADFVKRAIANAEGKPTQAPRLIDTFAADVAARKE